MSSSPTSFIPNNPEAGIKLVYSYEISKYHQNLKNFILGFTTCTSILWTVKFALSKKISNIFLPPLKLGIFATTYPVIFYKLNSNRIINILVDSDDKTAYAIIYGDLKNGLVKLDPEKGKWTKKGEDLVLILDGKHFFLDHDGKIHDLEAFYTIIGSFRNDKDFIKSDN